MLLLAGSQALMLSAIVLSMSLAAILGSLLAPDKSLATLPVAAMVVGTAMASLPAAMLMRRWGRRMGFLMGAGLGVAGSVLAGYALWQQSFELFVLGHLLLGSYQGFANYYRFAAAEAVDPAHTTRAMPARRMASVHGGVFPKCRHGSRFTYNVAPLARGPALASASASACGAPYA